MFMSLPAIHRAVTGHDENGKAIVSSQGRLPTVVEIAAVPGMVFHEVWATAGNPAAIDNGIDPTLMPLRLRPPKSGTRVRFVDFPSETPDVLVRCVGAIDGRAGYRARHGRARSCERVGRTLYRGDGRIAGGAALGTCAEQPARHGRIPGDAASGYRRSACKGGIHERTCGRRRARFCEGNP